VVGNLFLALGNALREQGSLCRPFTADIGLRTGPTTLRRPDLAIYCPPFERQARRSEHPVLVAEVFSASTQHVDQHAKLDEYKALESLQTILLLEPEQVDVGVWRRGSGGWMHHRLPDDLSAIVEAQGLGLSIALADIYRGVELRPRTGPKLIWPDDGDTLPKG
jgi:Uma2 family endonuclease